MLLLAPAKRVGYRTVHWFRDHIDQHCGYFDRVNWLPIGLSRRPATGRLLHRLFNKPLFLGKTNMFFITSQAAICIRRGHKHLSPGSGES